ncbi:MurR/RpiR family transcriptional regulator [Bacillus sp. FJAT-27251]|uniref:MurR/RpiR family transcriptional regulator n=1 Tax=Bacillus sp. FJAT-27251 TaxID=1684142 RepID=UPI0006A7926B|nr:MurR/RpiR family transcriptional regulator [Bacillus sp. FJAT-27251]
MQENPFVQIIKESFPSLSRGQKKVAEFIKDHMDEGALDTAYQLGKKSGVSETTVIRLAYALGYDGFSAMQEKIRKDWLAQKSPALDEASPAKEEWHEGRIFEKVVAHEGAVLQQLLQQVSAEEIWKSADRIITADRVYIAGFGSSYAAAYWLFYSLRQVRGNVSISNTDGYMPEEVCELTEDSVVVLFSFPRYRKETLNLAHLAKKQGAATVAITNRQLSPVGQLAEVTLTTEEKVDSSHNSIASVISLLEVLMAGIHSRDHERIRKRQQKLEMLYTDQELFLE